MNLDRWLTVFSIVLAIIFGAFAIWSYRRGVKRRRPTFVVHPGRHILADAVLTRIEGFELNFKQKPIGKRGVTTAHVYFWNDGELAILSSEVIAAYRIEFPPDTQILDVRILSTSRKNLGLETSIIELPNSCQATQIEFSLLEAKDGLTIQIIYDGPKDAILKFTGSCLGSPQPVALEASSNYFVSKKDRISQIYKPLIFAVLSFGTVALIGVLIAFLEKFVTVSTHTSHVIGETIGWGGGAVVAGIILFAVWLQFRQINATYVPPEIRS